MPSIVHEHELENPDPFDLDEIHVGGDQFFKVTSPQGTEDVDSPDEACDLILDTTERQFWE